MRFTGAPTFNQAVKAKLLRLKAALRAEAGQTLPIVLAMMVLGGLIVIPGVDYAATGLRQARAIDKSMKGLYAADAGIESAIWSIKNGTQPATSLSQTLNVMNVSMNTVSLGTYTLVAGQWETTGSHTTDLVISTNMAWDAGHNAYSYNITATWSGEEGNCKLIEVGARLPVGYSYEAASAALFGSNLSTGEPADTLDGENAHLLAWTFAKIDITTATQTFYFNGSGQLENDYAWAEATREDVGVSGELTGSFYRITAVATNPQDGTITAQVQANIMKAGSSATITSYRVIQQ